MVEAVLVERITADLRFDQHAAHMSTIFGGSPEWPTLAERLEQFRQILNEPAAVLDPEESELRDALGLRR